MTAMTKDLLKTQLEIMNALDDGPVARDRVRKVPPALREKGVQQFDMRSTGANMLSGVTTSIVYTPDHDAKTVLEAWLAVNDQIADELGAWALHQRASQHGDDFREASMAIWKDRGEWEDATPTGGTHDQKSDCPYCGEPTGSMRTHLPCDEQP